ncbi:atpA [Symbiodinium natans]|uniref:AtpA protein n=1 Tax=Symbiodinium natans TaxID=878477 RepID=A0A812QL89_9DINO|nr:atpA [Symbiodinium natans]
MHANLQADNAFFWRDEYGTLACGVLDWGGFNRTPFCMNFLGCLSGADPEVLLAHEEGIIRCFRDEYERCGGPHLPMEELLLSCLDEGDGGETGLPAVMCFHSGYHLGYITFVYESTTWLEREVYKLATKEEMATWDGILDDRFQERFRVRCRTSAIINSFAFYSLKGDHLSTLFKEWSKGKGADDFFCFRIDGDSSEHACVQIHSRDSSLYRQGDILPEAEVDVVQHHPEAAPSRGVVFEHQEAYDKNFLMTWEHRALNQFKFADTILQGDEAERAQLSQGLSSGILAVDVLAPIGIGQSMLICGPKDTGKSTLANQVVEHALAGRQVDKVVRFLSSPAPPADPALQRMGTLMQVAVPASPTKSSASYLPALFDAVAVAEEVRDGGKQALLVLDTVAPLLDAWDLALELAEAARGPGDAEALAAQRRAAFAALLERAANLQRGGSLTMLTVLETEAMAALGIPGQKKAPSGEDANEPIFTLDDFRGRRQSELERLQRLQERGVPLTERSLNALGLAPPGTSAPGVKSAREMQSLSDGQVVLDKSMASAGLFPAVVAGASFSRFGLGSKTSGGEAKARDVRPPALQAVAAHLRTLLALEQEAHFRPTAEAVDSHQSRQLQAVASALQQPHGTALLPEEMTALLLAACSGALDPLPLSEASEALRGGARSPLLLHLKEAAPGMLSRIGQESTLSQSTLRELEVTVRLFVKLKQAQV